MLAIHQLLFQEANPEMAGHYKQDNSEPLYIRFSVPHWHDVPSCMLQFGKLMAMAQAECDALEGTAQDEKVIEWTARLHHRMERIHPFEDGNGRSGRMLSSWILLHYDLSPLEVSPEDRNSYIDALAAADEGLSTADLVFADYWPHQTQTLTKLISFLEDILTKEVTFDLE